MLAGHYFPPPLLREERSFSGIYSSFSSTLELLNNDRPKLLVKISFSYYEDESHERNIKPARQKLSLDLDPTFPGK